MVPDRKMKGWHSEYSGTMSEIGFETGTSTACAFRHYGLHLVSSVHGDDFTTVGSKKDLDWFRQQLDGKYKVKKGARSGPGKADAKEDEADRPALRP